MYAFYSLILAIGFALMLPAFLLRRQKYAAGFSQRLGNYPDFKHDGRKVIWLHCVSVGETNAARPLVDELIEQFPDHRLVVSTTTKTGQELAQKIFKDKADAVVYFPFDFKFAVRRALDNFKPSLVLLMETEIWPRFIREAKAGGAKIAIVNGRLSERSVSRYKRVRPFISRVLQDIDLALMQAQSDANRLISLGMPAAKTIVTGNLKFDLRIDPDEDRRAEELAARFGFGDGRNLIIAASTHPTEEGSVLWAFDDILFRIPNYLLKNKPRLLIAPRHPERFDEVFHSIADYPRLKAVRRTSHPSEQDKDADVILLDSIGELRSTFRFAAVVFVGGSLIEHGGQSVLEPAAEGRAIVTGFHTFNFREIVERFVEEDAIYQLPKTWWVDPVEFLLPGEQLASVFTELLHDETKRLEMGTRAANLMTANQGATHRTIKDLQKLI